MYTKESICIISPHLRNALQGLTLSALEDIPHPDFEDLSLYIPFPYLWWFNRRDQIAKAVAESDAESQCYLSLMQNYMFDRLQSDWSKVDELTSKGLITVEYLNYIYTPGQILISEAVGNDLAQTRCYRVLNWMKKHYSRYDESPVSMIRASWWLFDGTFKEIEDDLIITAPDLTDEFKIESLSYYPQRFASPNLVRSLLDRGKMFWECRERKYVSTSDFGGDGLQSSVRVFLAIWFEYVSLTSNQMDSRFMIDMETYKYMHLKASGKEIDRHMTVIRTIDPQQMHHAELSARNDFIMCLPTTIVGFNMNKKEWGAINTHGSPKNTIILLISASS
ncbi:hypothetical protein FNYG_01183 [Fusarium nygamai]|uniref:DUF7025 domain-containing protein n=1 Tax=Gibberella nygamai TaxID=42673 RepID=A0A2K0WT00_GIBNY|nr:hypothetical protein FNYG_01183 [Fusarium nygamai]